MKKRHLVMALTSVILFCWISMNLAQDVSDSMGCAGGPNVSVPRLLACESVF